MLTRRKNTKLTAIPSLLAFWSVCWKKNAGEKNKCKVD